MKKLFAIALFILLTVSAFGNGIQLNGVGTRANSMGNAYTAIADDTTAMFWNPAGLGDIDGKLVSGGVTGVWPRAGRWGITRGARTDRPVRSAGILPRPDEFKRVY